MSSGKDDSKGAILSTELEEFQTHRNPVAGDIDETAMIIDGEDKTTPFVWVLVFAAAVGGLLFGYDTGVISGVLVHEDFPGDMNRPVLTSNAKEIITSATTLGALFGGLASGILADITGRKVVIAIADVIFFLSSIMQAVAFGPNSYWIMAAGRFIVGLAVGLAALVIPLYIGELAPTAQRGRLVTLNVVAITFGQVFAYIIDLICEHVPHGWRIMVGVGAVPPIIQIAMLVFLPESPRYLIRAGKTGQATKILKRLYPQATEKQIEWKTQAIEGSFTHDPDQKGFKHFIQTWKKLHFRGENLRGLVIACGLQGIQQFSGFNTLIYYAPTLFRSVGFRNSILIGLVIAIINFAFTLVALVIIDKAGRRRIACLTIPAMSLSLVLASISFHFLTKDTGGVLTDGGQGLNQKWSPVVLTTTLLYVACYATGIGNIPWQQGELLAYDVRGLGVSISTSVNWGANLIIGSTFLTLIDRITAAGAFGFYAGLCALGALFCIALYPDTSGLSLEETQEIFRTGFGIQKAEEMRRAKRGLASPSDRGKNDTTLRQA